jgi:hypothetical protein
MHDPHGVAGVDDGDDLPAERCGGALGVVAPGDDPVEELPSLAELHDEVDGVAVLVGAPELDDVAVAGEVVHDVDLAADVVGVVPAHELARGDGLAGVAAARGLVGGEVGDPELAPAQLAAEGVGRADVLHGAAEDAADAWRGRARLLLIGRRRVPVLRPVLGAVIGVMLLWMRRVPGGMVVVRLAVAGGAAAHG